MEEGVLDKNGKPKPPPWVFESGSDEWEVKPEGAIFRCTKTIKVEVQIIAGGGGGGGGYKGRLGGEGGKAGEMKWVPLDLDPGIYFIVVGRGGNGGRGYAKNEASSPATPGTQSVFSTETGRPLLVCKGGAAGKDGASTAGNEKGGKGEDVVSDDGRIIGPGGAGGPRDRDGLPGKTGGGGGGIGDFKGPENHWGGKGGDGRVTIWLRR
jgi:hypothetical protein